MNIAATPTVQPLTSLTLFTPSGDSFPIQASDATLMTAAKGIQQCRLAIQVSLEQYQHITTHHLFHLKSELLSPTFREDFQSDKLIEIIITLQPQLLQSLPQSLAQQTTDPNNLIDYLAKLSQTATEEAFDPEQLPTDNDAETSAADTNGVTDPLIQTDSWFALEVKQSQPSGDIGYRTLWSYLSPSALAKEVTSNGQISAAMGHLFQDLATPDEAAAEAALSEAFDELLQGLGSWVDEQISSTEDAFANLADELTDAFETWLAPAPPSDISPRPSQRPIYRAMLTFFSDDDWEFTKLRGESTLQLAFQGQHGQWTCYAVARDEQSQFLFYSVYPTTVPEKKQHGALVYPCRARIAEYLTRANYGLVQGNFEFDFDRGEIRYKTGLDATHLSVNAQVIQQLVYTNVTIMDHYLPGILSVIEQGLDVKAALQTVETKG